MTNPQYQAIRQYLKTDMNIWTEITPRQTEIARLYFIDQRTMNDIAAMLGINQGTVSRSVEGVRKKCCKYITLPRS